MGKLRTARPAGVAMTRLSALKYYGGKSANSAAGTGRWIADMLPTDAQMYVEPFCGMLGVLLQRPQAPVEAANDLHGHLIFWWENVRDRGGELAEKIYDTPYSEGDYKKASANWKTGWEGVEDLERARQITVLLWQTFAGHSAWTDWEQPAASGTRRAPLSVANTIRRLQDRTRNISFYNRDASRIVDKFGGEPSALIYLDPPYEGTVEQYVDSGFDRGEMAELLGAATARCAISGYGNEWDGLGWDRYERDVWSSMDTAPHVEHGARTEVLWANFDLNGQIALDL